MLVLRRKPGETIIINGDIRISVLEIEKDRVKIGIVAPPHVTILREELLQRSEVDARPSAPAQPDHA